MAHRVLVTSVLFMAFAFVAGCGGSKISMSNYEKVNTGMTQAQVEAILGKGTEQASSDVSVPGVAASGKALSWQEGGKIVSVMLMNGKVMSKAQTGL